MRWKIMCHWYMGGLKEIRISDNIKCCKIFTCTPGPVIEVNLFSTAHSHGRTAIALWDPWLSASLSDPFFHLMMIHVNISIFSDSGSLGGGVSTVLKITFASTLRKKEKYGMICRKIISLMRPIFYLRANQEQCDTPLINIIFTFLESVILIMQTTKLLQSKQVIKFNRHP